MSRPLDVGQVEAVLGALRAAAHFWAMGDAMKAETLVRTTFDTIDRGGYEFIDPADADRRQHR